MRNVTIKGRKGGSSNTTTPTESPDSLQSTSYAKILLALGEGEWEGGLDGTNIFLDGTPIVAADGTQNFPGVKWEFRPGTPDQEYIQGMPDVENEITVGTELTSQTPWVRSLTNTQLSAFRLRFSWQQLQQQLDNGDVVGYRIEYAIDVATDGGAYQEMLKTAIDGKTTTKYERSHRIDLPKAMTGWQVRVRRLTANSTSNRIADKMVTESITELIDVKLRYPETALLFVQFDAKQFQNIPAVSCEPKMGIVRVPTTYDPITRSYTGTWDGSFKWAWTNNPAWVFYDLLINDRYSIGERIKAENLVMTKFDLYAIAQYCDQLVPDGRGGDGLEPRFLCDAYIQSQEEAWTVLRDFANIFRGMTYWAKNSMNALADMPRDLDYTYTRANVKDGEFRNSSASEKTHYSMAMVSWADPANGYQDAVAPVFENALIRRYNIKQADITAIGCTRETEAIRRGRWLLLTNDKDRVINFTVGMDGNIPLPGYIIGVADETLAGRPLGGRISAVSGRNITLDRESSAAVGERLIVNLPSGKSQARTIQAVNGRIVTVTTEYSEAPVAECVWAVDASDLAIQLFRVTGVTENEDGVSFDITAIEHDPNKYARIDTGARIEDRPITVIPPGVQPPPKNVAISSFSTINQNIAVTTLRVTWEPAESAIAYEAEWRRDNGNWIPAARTSTQGFEVPGIYAGRYQARVRAINAAEISSIWANAPETYLKGKEGKPPVPVGFKASPLLWGIQLDWGFPDGAEDTLKTEIQYADNAGGNNAMLLADIPYPLHTHTMTGLKAGQEFWFRARLQDRTGNQGDWTGWIKGQSNANAGDYLESIGDGFLTDKDGDRLTGDIDTNIEAIIQNALANNATVDHQYAQLGMVRADILIVKTTIAEVDHALAELSTQVQAQIDDVTAVLEDKLTATVDADGATAIHTLKAGVRVNGVFYNAGMSIAVLAETGKPVITRIGFNANQFVLMSGSGDTQYSPFAVINGQVFISDAFIQNASITSAKIADAAITNAKISGFIQSDNFSATSGWRMDKSGAGAGQIQINGGDGNGRMEIRGDQINVYDAGGNLRVRMGRL
ncbi:TipJ family phage tail tip protein [Serratia marcescens]|uniref:host specificity protein J n=1 Tax=Serratia marcescens TaxID=615 RepID=UPI0021BDC3EA|nr:host specificity protein J [Serratia marcescens]